ncbi:MAG: hypothetical protein JST75_00655 [Bacteroidetes bacterium]|nr:hypothetical protein [Bacteroidota bacterium]
MIVFIACLDIRRAASPKVTFGKYFLLYKDQQNRGMLHGAGSEWQVEISGRISLIKPHLLAICYLPLAFQPK